MTRRHVGSGVLVWVAAALVSTGAWAAPQNLPPRALVVTDAHDLAGLREARSAVEAAGGAVQGMMPPSMLLVRLEPEMDRHLVGVAGIRAIERGPVAEGPALPNARRVPRSKVEEVAVAAWNQRLRAKSPQALRKPLPPELLGMDILEVPAGAAGDGDGDSPPGAPPPRSSSTNSRYLAGDCVVTVFLTESDGSLEASTENWTTQEETQVTAEIQEGLSWLADYVNTAYNANLTFIYEWHYREPTKYEPIRTSAAFPGGNAAAYEILQRRGYSGSTSGGRLFNSAQRKTYGADMAFLIFVADSSADADGYFADGYIAYAYLGGPWMVQNYRNDGWGISRMNQVTAHETGHIFGAGDEYAASGATATRRYGYLNVLNGNAENGGTGASCLMNRNSLTICKWTIGQLGLNLPDLANDGTPDCFQFDAGGTVRRDQLRAVAATLDDDSAGASRGNGNGTIEGGEIFELRTTLQNEAFVRMRGVTGTLSTASPYVLILDGRCSFGDVADAGGQAAAADPFVVSVLPDAPAATVTFTVELATAQGWHFSFSIDVAVVAALRDIVPPAVPTGLAVTGLTPTSASLRWNPNAEPDLDHYNLYRSENAGYGYVLVAQPAGNTYTDAALAVGRTYYYKVSASDVWGNESNRSAGVAAMLTNEPPVVAILSPDDGAAFASDEEIDFSASAIDREDGAIPEAIIWTSSLDGPLGQGASLSSTLRPGTHVVQVSATDSHGATGLAAITVVVLAANDQPAVTIASPATGDAFTTLDDVTLVATANDPEDGDLTPFILWTSNLDGELGTGGLVIVRLSRGAHTITASVTDRGGTTAIDEVVLSVDLTPLEPPADLRANQRNDTVKLRWRDTNRDETGYRVERSPAGGWLRFVVLGKVPANDREFKDTGVAPGAYLYRVRALRDAQVGPASEIIEVSVAVRGSSSAAKARRGAATVPTPEPADTTHDEPHQMGEESPDEPVQVPPPQAPNPARPPAPAPAAVRSGPTAAVTIVYRRQSGAFSEIHQRFQAMRDEMRASIRRPLNR